MSRVEQFEKIRRGHKDGQSIRELADEHHVHRRTVRDAIASAAPPPRKTPERESPALGPHKATIRAWLEADKDVHRKQRHTARRVFTRLVEEHDADVSESTVRAYVAEVKAELSSGRLASVPQTKVAGSEAEVDFGEFRAVVGGELLRLWLFVMRLSKSGKTFRKAYVHQAGESFYDGHVEAFAFFGGVPTGHIRYDNPKPAVIKVLLGRERDLNVAFMTLRSHYGFTSWFCEPGLGGAHEKGGVEGEIGRFRRNHMVPVPEFDTLDELNAYIAERGIAEDAIRRIAGHRLPDGTVPTVDEEFALEQPLLDVLPDDPYDVAVELTCKVDTKARVSVRTANYSVPARLVGRRVRVRLDATHVNVLDGATVVARHQRSPHKNTDTLVLDHYLELLGRKPGAMAGSTALVQARAAGTFTAAHQQFWDGACKKLGDGAGTRALIDVLLEHRRLPAEVIVAALADANKAGITDVNVVLVQARTAADRRPDADVVPIGQALAAYDRPAPTLDGYDELLTTKDAS
jgi:transposase